MMGFGGNLQGNAARLVDLGKSYDLVVVTGSYYALNFIGQINILADDDITRPVRPARRDRSRTSLRTQYPSPT